MARARIAAWALLGWLLALPALAQGGSSLLGAGAAPEAARGFCAAFGPWAEARHRQGQRLLAVTATPATGQASPEQAMLRRLLDLSAQLATIELKALNLDALGAPAWMDHSVQGFELEVPREREAAGLVLLPLILWHGPPGAAHPVTHVQLPEPLRLRERREPRAEGGERRLLGLDIAMPGPPGGPGWWPRATPASVLVIGCAGPDLAFLATRRAGVMARFPALLWTGLGVLLAYLLVAAASPGARAVRESPDASPGLKWRSWFDPVLITQDEHGFGSLRRLQLFYFTFVIFGLSLYILLRAGYLTAISDQLLWLMGIAASGTAFATLADRMRAAQPGAAGREGPSRETIRLLAQAGVIERRDQFGSWLDVVTEGPGLGVHRVQAVIFSLVVGVFIVSQGSQSLAALTIPDSYLVLLGLSQAVYVGIHAASPREDWAAVNAAAAAFRQAVPDLATRFAPGVRAAAAGLSPAQQAALAALRAAAAKVMPRLAPEG
ncbi:MAG: hypothetical protein N3D18_03565 [Roseococcus sp.]|nr:hypothetical protein [Roseococcus sp.]